MQLTLQIELDDADAEELEAAVESLLADLSEAPVDVERPLAEEEAPPGSKGLTRSAVNVLLLTGNAIALELAVDYVKEWLSRRVRSRVKLKSSTGSEVVVLLPGVSEADARHLIMRMSQAPST